MSDFDIEITRENESMKKYIQQLESQFADYVQNSNDIICTLEEKLAEKDREYFLIRYHNKKLCEQLEQTKKLLAEAVEVIKRLEFAYDISKERKRDFDGVYKDAREFLAKVKVSKE
jgi:hypothetical protein